MENILGPSGQLDGGGHTVRPGPTAGLNFTPGAGQTSLLEDRKHRNMH